MTEMYRVGQDDNRLIYRDGKLFAMVFDAVDARTVVADWNALEGVASEEVARYTLTEKGEQAIAAEEPETFRDGMGDWWVQVNGGRYALESVGTRFRSLQYIKDNYGAWVENAD